MASQDLIRRRIQLEKDLEVHDYESLDKALEVANSPWEYPYGTVFRNQQCPEYLVYQEHSNAKRFSTHQVVYYFGIQADGGEVRRFGDIAVRIPKHELVQSKKTKGQAFIVVPHLGVVQEKPRAAEIYKNMNVNQAAGILFFLLKTKLRDCWGKSMSLNLPPVLEPDKTWQGVVGAIDMGAGLYGTTGNGRVEDMLKDMHSHWDEVPFSITVKSQLKLPPTVTELQQIATYGDLKK